MQLQLQDFTTLVRNMAASVQSAANSLIDLTTGSVLRAILEANASIALWMQWLIVQVLAQTRAATSNGPDLDSWVGDFSLARLPGQAAAATVTFARLTAGLATTIPAGSLVKTLDGSVTFRVLPDLTRSDFDPVAAAYTVPAAAAAISLSVQAVAPGVTGNVLPNTIGLIATALPGIDSVTNSNPAAGGADPEPDANLRARFTNFIDSRARATPAAIAFAIDSLQQHLQHVVTENRDPSGAYRPGFFTVTVDDGSGAPPTTLLATIAAAVDAVRPVGTQFAVQPARIVAANIAMTVNAGVLDKPSAQANVAAAINFFTANLPIGAPLSLTRLAAIAYGADSRVTNVSGIAINGAADLLPPPTGLIRVGTLTID